MEDGRNDYASSGQGAGTLSHAAQVAYAVGAAAKGGVSAAGATAGAAFSGPLGIAARFLMSRKTFWKVIGGILAFLFLWMFIIANLIGLVLNYLGFASADSFANAAQSTELSNLRVRIEQIFSDQERRNEIVTLIEAARDLHIQKINKDKEEKYAGYEIQIVDEWETKLKGSLCLYLSVYLAENWDPGAIRSFLGYPDSLGLDMSTNLSSPYDAYFREAAQTYHVPAALLIAMGKVESGFNPRARSGAGAMGIMQLMPATAASLGVSDPYDPKQNIMGGAKYIASNIERFKKYPDCLELALAAYNAGPGTVIKNNYQVPPKIRRYVDKVLGYVDIQKRQAGEGTEEDLSAPFNQLKETIAGNAESFFAWSYTGEKEVETTETAYYLLSETGRAEIDQATYEQMLSEGGSVIAETRAVKKKAAEYTIALMLHSQPSGAGGGYEYKYVTDQRTFELIVKVLQLMQDGIEAVRNNFFSLFSWTDFVTGGRSEEAYTDNIDTAGDVITYDTVGNGVKKVVYYNQGEKPWKSMSYGSSTIGRSGCGPTSLAIVISTLTNQTVTPQMTCAYAIKNGEYKSGKGTSHSFPANAAHHWGLTCKRVGKNKMSDVVQALKDGKMVVVICAPYTITKSGNGHYIVLTGVTRDGYITIADCGSRQRTGKVYSVGTIKSYGRDLADGAFWIIGT